MKVRLPKVLRYLLRVVVFLWLAFIFTLLYFGIGGPLTTLSVYGLLIWTGGRIFRWIGNKKGSTERLQNLRLLVLSTLLALLAGELSLRFVFRTHLSYKETNGGWWYVSPYRQVRLENIVRHHYFGERDVTLPLRKPHSQVTYHKPEFRFVHRYNNEGLRDRDFVPGHKPGHFRVMALGDSFTEGVGAAADSTWPRMLEAELESRIPGLEVEMMNFGSSGSDLVFEAAKLEKIGLKYHPDLVILALNSTDLDDILVRGGRERFREDGRLQYRKGSAMEYLYSFSYIFRLFVHATSQRNALLLTPEQEERARAEAALTILAELEHFQTLARRQGFNFLAVFHPTQYELENRHFPLEDIYRQFEPQAPAWKVNVYQSWLHPDDPLTQRPADLFWPLDRHHNAKGYAALARAIGAAMPEAALPGDSTGQ